MTAGGPVPPLPCDRPGRSEQLEPQCNTIARRHQDLALAFTHAANNVAGAFGDRHRAVFGQAGNSGSLAPPVPTAPTDLGGHDTRVGDHHGDAIVGGLDAQRIEKTGLSELARAISRALGHAGAPSQRRHADDQPARALEMRIRVAHAPDRSHRIDSEQPLEGRKVLDRVEARVHRDAGIGDQHIDAAVGFGRSLDETAAVVFLGHVGRHADRLAAERPAFVAHAVQRVRPPCRQRQFRPLLCQLPSQFSADAVARAGDHNDLTAEVHPNARG